MMVPLVPSFAKFSTQEELSATTKSSTASNAEFQNKFGTFGMTLADALPSFSLYVVGLVANYLANGYCTFPRLQILDSQVATTNDPPKYKTICEQRKVVKSACAIDEYLLEILKIKEDAEDIKGTDRNAFRLFRNSIPRVVARIYSRFHDDNGFDPNHVYFTVQEVETMKTRLFPTNRSGPHLIEDHAPFVLTLLRSKLPTEQPVYRISKEAMLKMIGIAKELRECLKKENQEQLDSLVSQFEALEMSDGELTRIDSFKKTRDRQSFDKHFLDPLIKLEPRYLDLAKPKQD